MRIVCAFCPFADMARPCETIKVPSESRIFFSVLLTGGSALTRELAKQHRKPWIHIDLKTTPYPDAARMIREWVRRNEVKAMNVAGARGSKDPKVYDAVMTLLEATLGNPNHY